MCRCKRLFDILAASAESPARNGRENEMRLNVYREELGPEAEVVEKTADTGQTYYGARLYLKSAPELHATAGDDDRSAVTIWYGDPIAAQYAVDHLNAATQLAGGVSP